MKKHNPTTKSPLATDSVCPAIQLQVQAKEQMLGGLNIRRSLPARGARRIGPWVFFDHMGPTRFPAKHGVDIAPHPHINLATVTYLLEGEMLHQDSVGSVQSIRPGDINLMVAGSGITHSERQSEATKSQSHRIHGFQLWLALPSEAEETDPAFYHYPSQQIPALTIEGVRLRVLMGTAYGVTSPVKTFSPTLYVEAQIKTGQTLAIPAAAMRGLYIVSGQVKIGDTQLTEHTFAVLNDQQNISITAKSDSQIVILGGDDIGHRYMDWNFVSSRIERVKQARQQWISQQFPLIPTDQQEYIPYPDLNI